MPASLRIFIPATVCLQWIVDAILCVVKGSGCCRRISLPGRQTVAGIKRGKEANPSRTERALSKKSIATSGPAGIIGSQSVKSQYASEGRGWTGANGLRVASGAWSWMSLAICRRPRFTPRSQRRHERFERIRPLEQVCKRTRSYLIIEVFVWWLLMDGVCLSVMVMNQARRGLNLIVIHKSCKAQALEFKAGFERDRGAIQSELWTPAGPFNWNRQIRCV
jgi:hypothetical protein